MELTTRLLATSEAAGVGRAEALRRSMLALMSDAARPYYAHPMFWGPFVVIGEGGRAGGKRGGGPQLRWSGMPMQWTPPPPRVNMVMSGS